MILLAKNVNGLLLFSILFSVAVAVLAVGIQTSEKQGLLTIAVNELNRKDEPWPESIVTLSPTLSEEEIKNEIADQTFLLDASKTINQTLLKIDAAKTQGLQVIHNIQSFCTGNKSSLNSLQTVCLTFKASLVGLQGTNTEELTTLLQNPRLVNNTNPQLADKINDDINHIIKSIRDLIKIGFATLSKAEDLYTSANKIDDKWCNRTQPQLEKQGQTIEQVSSSLSSSSATNGSYTIVEILLVSAGLVFGLSLLCLPPSSVVCVSMICVFYACGLCIFAISYFSFDIPTMVAASSSTSDSVLSATYETFTADVFACYGFALAGGMAGVVPFVIYSPTHSFPMTLMGMALGAVLGVQANCLGLYLLRLEPVYYTIGLSMGCGMILFGIIYLIISLLGKVKQPALSFVQVWIGCYLTIKSIGLFVGNYPDEFALSAIAETVSPQTMAYIICMFVISLLLFALHACCFRLVDAPSTLPAHNLHKQDSPTASSKMKHHSAEEPLLQKTPINQVKLESAGKVPQFEIDGRGRPVFGGGRSTAAGAQTFSVPEFNNTFF